MGIRGIAARITGKITGKREKENKKQAGGVAGYRYNEKTGKYEVYACTGHGKCRTVFSAIEEDKAIGRLCELLEEECREDGKQ